ncbi:type I-C CRISPR-associated protein Cas8c/Csd1 [Cohnella massiliensis]|uniref:type I-C CRISPR-associated protein Cas8c/Csd1 n=1 Tax=Cohnella massiliensis TaxID=1816691 RepID=UPI0009BB614C|nr:type I-C CRISPR-associated protein Cas8c/Csd1 [Cohnella massiliensis]
MERDEAFGRLLAIANVLGDRVFEKKKIGIANKYGSAFAREPRKAIEKIHEELMQYTHKFGDAEMVLLDMFGEIMAGLDISDFTNKPVGAKYLQSFYSQQHILSDEIVGYAEAAYILGWDKRKIGTYLQRGVFPEPIQRLASGPIWTRRQIEDYKKSRG